MFTAVSTLPAELARSLAAIDLSALQSDQAWLLALLRVDGPALVRVLWRLLGREQDVLDAYQDCVCRMLSHAKHENAPPSRAYVFRSAVNIALDMRRQRRVRIEHQEFVARHDSERRAMREPDSRELIDRLRTAIENLPVRLRDIVVLRDLAEMDYRDLTKILGLTNGTARVYRREAVLRLAEQLRDEP